MSSSVMRVSLCWRSVRATPAGGKREWVGWIEDRAVLVLSRHAG
jgi:hypothetical protein